LKGRELRGGIRSAFWRDEEVDGNGGGPAGDAKWICETMTG